MIEKTPQLEGRNKKRIVLYSSGKLNSRRRWEYYEPSLYFGAKGIYSAAACGTNHHLLSKILLRSCWEIPHLVS